jgi:hypothetical protein
MGSDLGPRPPTKDEIVRALTLARRRSMRRGPPPTVVCPACGRAGARLRKGAVYFCQRSRGGCGARSVRRPVHVMPRP